MNKHQETPLDEVPADENKDDEVIITAENESSTSEVGGPAGPEPTRYGDWERKGRCIDF